MMSLVSATTPNFHSEKILCFYINATSHLQIIKITNVDDFHFEWVVFPGQRLLFEAFPTAQLSVFTSERNERSPMHTVSCEQLQVEESGLSLVK